MLNIIELSDIIQNTSNVYSVEISSSNEVDSGILIFPLNTLYFSGDTFLRCTDENGRAAIRVVSFDTKLSTVKHKIGFISALQIIEKIGLRRLRKGN